MRRLPTEFLNLPNIGVEKPKLGLTGFICLMIILILLLSPMWIMLFGNSMMEVLPNLQVCRTKELNIIGMGIINGSNTSKSQLFLLNEWVHDNITYDSSINVSSVYNIRLDLVSVTLNERRGVCHHMAVLLCSLVESSTPYDCVVKNVYRVENNIRKDHLYSVIYTNDFIAKCDPTVGVCNFNYSEVV